MKLVYSIMLAVILPVLAVPACMAQLRTSDVAAPGAGIKSDIPMTGAGPANCAARLNLSGEQMEKMWQIRERFHSDTQTIRYELFRKNMELKALYADPKVTDAEILTKQKEVDTARQKIRDRMAQLRLEQRKILNPEQVRILGESGCGLGPGFNQGGFGPRSWGSGYFGR